MIERPFMPFHFISLLVPTPVRLPMPLKVSPLRTLYPVRTVLYCLTVRYLGAGPQSYVPASARETYGCSWGRLRVSARDRAARRLSLYW